MSRYKFKFKIVNFGVTVFAVILLSLLVIALNWNNIPTTKKIILFDSSTTHLVSSADLMPDDVRPLIEDGRVFLPFNVVKEKIDSTIWRDIPAKKTDSYDKKSGVPVSGERNGVFAE